MFTPYKKAIIQRAQRGEMCTLQERCLHCSRSMAANGGSDGRRENEGFYQHNNSSETLSEGRGRDMEERAMLNSGTFWPSTGPAMTLGTTSTITMIPAPTSMTPVTVPNVPGLRVNIVPGPEGATIDIHPLDPDSSSSEEAMDDKTVSRPKLGGSLFLGHLASYPSVNRLSHFVQESLPLGPLIVQTSRSVAKSTGRRILRPLHATPFSLEASQTGADQSNDPALRRLLLLLDATAAYTLRGIDHIVLLFLEAGGKVRRWVVSSVSQLRELAKYLNRTYYQEASKWGGASDIVVFCGAVGFTVAVGAFDALIFVAEWFFDGREAREIEKRERATSV